MGLEIAFAAMMEKELASCMKNRLERVCELSSCVTLEYLGGKREYVTDYDYCFTDEGRKRLKACIEKGRSYIGVYKKPSRR